jgi:hypothetical protein
MTFEETTNSIHAQRVNLMQTGLKPTHVVFGFAEWDAFRHDARSQNLVFNRGRPFADAEVMGMKVVFSEAPLEAKVLSDGARI